MRKLYFFILLSYVLTFSGCGNSSNENKNEGVQLSTTTAMDSMINVNPHTLALGERHERELREESFVFKIKNLSDSALVIDKIDVSCHCVSILSYPHSLQQNEQGDIRGTINLKNQSGHVRKSIFINYNNGALKILKITADITK